MIDQYKLVPVEPTPEMLKAANCMIDCDPIWMARAYRAMLAAAPEAPQPAKREPLTDEEIDAVMRKALGYGLSPSRDDLDFARAIERAHGIGEQE